jgi:threonine/homoserine/homoserine lactone efflux protein
MLPPLNFLLAATFLAVIPGPGIAYVVARTASAGKAEGLASSLGAALGGMVHVIAAALGLSLLIAESAIAYSIIKYLGAAYLIYLGIQLLLSDNRASGVSPLQPAGLRNAFRDGIIVEALNVKTAMFFLAFLPQFVSSSFAAAPQFIMLGSICVLLNTIADVTAVVATNKLMSVNTGTLFKRKLLSRLSGSTMLVLGILLAMSNRKD